MKTMENRLDASLFIGEDKNLLASLLELVQRDTHPCLKGQDGTEIRLPAPIYQLLLKVLQDMRHGKAIVLMPEEETFTTQAAANFLGMSRQFFITLLEGGQIPFHRVGTHRRVYFKDLLEYEKMRDTVRRERLGRLFRTIREAGLDNADYNGEYEGVATPILH